MEMDQELLKKAKAAETPEALLAFAKENGTDLTEESAKAYFDMLHQEAGEISDEELDNISGGCNAGDGRKIVSALISCAGFVCKKCGGLKVKTALNHYCKECGKQADCTNCMYCSYEKGLWLCNKGR